MMTAYGTRIKSDITFPLDLSHDSETKYEVELSLHVLFSETSAIGVSFEDA